MIDHIAVYINRHHQKAILIFFTLSIFLLSVGIYQRLSTSVRIAWTTESEVETLGFNLLRDDLADPGNGQKVNPQLILAQGSPISGISYHFIDREVQAGKSYIYHLQEIITNHEIVELESIEIRVKPKGVIEIGIGLVLSAMALFLYIRKQKPHSEIQA
ncbi:MAG: hypothetical protein K0B14_16445 [Anaerolineaceae bacterium]|nr:hypothetical protein [Anaerolineaceae bacterium]